MPNHIMDLRKKIGNMPINLCAAAVIILNEKNEVLLIRRGDNNRWALPAGCMELGESIEDTARREAFEETGLTLGKMEFIGVYSGLEELHYIYPNGDEIYCVTSAFICKDFIGTIKSDGIESLDIRFFSKEDIPEVIHTPDRPILRYFMDNY